MKTLLATTAAMIAIAGAPAFAAAHLDAATLTCADFLALSDEDKGMAIEAIQEASMSDEVANDEAMSEEQEMSLIADACAGNEDKLVSEASMAE